MSIAEHDTEHISPQEKKRIAQAEEIVDDFMPRAILFFQIDSGHKDEPIPEFLIPPLKAKLVRAVLRHKPSYGSLEHYLYRTVSAYLIYLRVEAFLSKPLNGHSKELSKTEDC